MRFISNNVVWNHFWKFSKFFIFRKKITSFFDPVVRGEKIQLFRKSKFQRETKFKMHFKQNYNDWKILKIFDPPPWGTPQREEPLSVRNSSTWGTPHFTLLLLRENYFLTAKFFLSPLTFLYPVFIHGTSIPSLNTWAPLYPVLIHGYPYTLS